ncbi:MAG: nucleotide exchange factor GrpE [Chloracidobacterium sp.]|nr:nucleotide exchange factor GrpE [Chloracidobacterium sp.]
METSVDKKKVELRPGLEIADGYALRDADSDLNDPILDGADSWREDFESERDARLRLAAEYENYRRRTKAEIARAADLGKREILEQLLEIADDLDLAVANSSGADARDAELVQMMYRKLRAVLEANGVVGFDSVGEAFDPERHEALEVINESSSDPGTVHSQIRRGYFFSDRLLRPALVIVAQ